ncbi:MAG TPA: hypothetical protein VFN70_18305 [Burkholderiales bacterium]|nr:hypothetical protein [Burkholderiales bacterium]
MPKPRDFTPAQAQVIRATALKIWHEKFEWMKATKKTKTSPARLGGQEAMALALGVSQQTVSSLLDLKGAGNNYTPGYTVATAVANLDGKTLDDLIGQYSHPDAADDDDAPESATAKRATSGGSGSTFANLDVCISFHAATKQWSPWTIAAARAGYFGLADFAPPEWVGKLDALEKTLERGRKTA